jgi:hypothetical protein
MLGAISAGALKSGILIRVFGDVFGRKRLSSGELVHSEFVAGIGALPAFP